MIKAKKCGSYLCRNHCSGEDGRGREPGFSFARSPHPWDLSLLFSREYSPRTASLSSGPNSATIRRFQASLKGSALRWDLDVNSAITGTIFNIFVSRLSVRSKTLLVIFPFFKWRRNTIRGATGRKLGYQTGELHHVCISIKFRVRGMNSNVWEVSQRVLFLQT